MAHKLDDAISLRMRDLNYHYNHYSELLPMYSNVPCNSSIDGFVITTGMYSGIFSLIVLGEMIELCDGLPSQKNVKRHNATWWFDRLSKSHDILPMDKSIVGYNAGKLPRYSRMNSYFYDDKQATLIPIHSYWEEAIFVIMDDRIEYYLKSHFTRLLPKVCRLLVDNPKSSWDRSKFEFVESHNGTIAEIIIDRSQIKPLGGSPTLKNHINNLLILNRTRKIIM